ncbi:glycosyltransferase family 4 protein [Patescibacteria group bacterium]|nr:glycosyltransferase family 4 protein [Patescibacteria group bacterium]
MRIAIFTPYLDSFGGGERYMLTAAEVLLKNHQVDLLIDSHLRTLNPQQLKDDLAKRLNLQLDRLKVVNAPLGAGANFLQRCLFLSKYDVLIALTDGSIFFSTSKKSFLHFQVPFQNPHPHSLWHQLKLHSFKQAIFNSSFTKKIIETSWPIRGEVIYPPVEVEKFKMTKKKKYILSVGRFFSYLKTKKHEEMIQTFAKLYSDQKVKGWSLHLAGSIGDGDMGYLHELKIVAQKLPVYFYPNLEFDKLVKLYSESAIYWHAAGFAEDDPTKMEHFGITTVEAMAAGCAPVVINKGGQTEIVKNGENGFLWDDLETLCTRTIELIEDAQERQRLAKKARQSAQLFSKESFSHKINALINK